MPDKVIVLSELPKCDLCGRTATHDSYLPEHRTWGMTCQECFDREGCTGGFRLALEVKGV